jgi:hypothetical protein
MVAPRVFVSGKKTNGERITFPKEHREAVPEITEIMRAKGRGTLSRVFVFEE